MSSDNSNDRVVTNACEVVSEYFSYRIVMDEGCLKNEQVNHSITNSPKPKLDRPQKKPTRKRIRGQKDIRTLIKPKKNELVTYCKDFDLICKQAGIDADPEQIQLSIAISKSVQDLGPVNEENSNSEKALTSQQRKRKIRTTLQEYGFKVPEIKRNEGKKIRKYRKHYKLLLVSGIEKNQVIADKYAQILLRNLNICEISEKNQVQFQHFNSDLYNLSTNISYDCMKNNEIFYVDNLVEKSLPKRDHMLRDWSGIPGRPISPKLEQPDINIDSIEFSQEELAVILSGTIATTQDIVKEKYMNSSECKRNIDNLEIHTQVSNIEIVYPNKNTELKDIVPENQTVKDNLIENSSDRTNYKEAQNMSPPTHRSCSPDIFDDEVTIIMDSSRDKLTMQEDFSTKPVVREQIDFMDLTECVNIVNYITADNKPYSYLSQGIDKTRINQNDTMELTRCVTAASQNTLNGKRIVTHYGKGNDEPDIEEACRMETMDLTQSPNLNNSSIVMQHNNCDNKSLDDTIIMIDNDYCAINTDTNTVKLTSNECEVIDLVGDDHTEFNNISPKHSKDYDNDCGLGNLSNNNTSTSLRNEDYNKAKTVNDNSLKKHKIHEDFMDLTQSSSSEGSLDSHHGIIHSKKILDSHTDMNSLSNEVADDGLLKINDINSVPEINKSSVKKTKYGNHLDDKPKFIKTQGLNAKGNVDCDSDREYDNISQISSKNTENITQKSDFHENHIITGNDPNGECQFDLMQQSDCSENRSCSPKAIEIPDDLGTVDDNHHYAYNFLGDYNKKTIDAKEFVEVDESDTQKTIKCSNNSHYDVNRAYQLSIEYENDRAYDDIFNSLTKSKKNTILTSKSYEDEDDSFSNFDKREVTFECDPNIESRGIDSSRHSDNFERETCSPKVVGISEELGKRNDVSVDYDELYKEEGSKRDCDNSFLLNDKVLSEELVSGSSQVFDISDDEFNYSVDQHNQENRLIQVDRISRFDIGGTSTIDGLLDHNKLAQSKLRCSCSSLEANRNENSNKNCLPESTIKNTSDLLGEEKGELQSFTAMQSGDASPPPKYRNTENIIVTQTPQHNDYTIKTDQVTPMPNYENMTSPEREEELDKYGIKPLKRKRAIQILTHIYNQTHPVMQVISEECLSPSKVRKKNDCKTFPTRIIASEIDSILEKNSKPSLDEAEMLSQKSATSRKESSKKSHKSPTKYFECSKNADKENSLYNRITQSPDIRDIECGPEDWIFQKKEKAKVHSCRVPLHVAFHNYVSSRRPLREAILKYEPIDIDHVHKGLVSIGYRYNPKDLLKFMDKKCITVKTAEKTRNNK